MHYFTMRAKRTLASIRSKIQNALRERPMTAWEICQSKDLGLSSVQKQLEYLEAIGVVKKSHFNVRDGIELWTIRQK